MKKAIYPGSFDPVTYGHLDIAQRAAALFDEVIFVVAVNPTKAPLLSTAERVKLIEIATGDMKNVKVTSSADLIANVARVESAVALIRGLRHVSDFEYEFQMAMMNYHLNPDVSTVLLIPDEKYIHLNSTVIKDIVRLNGDVSRYIPDTVLAALQNKLIS
ncbi:MAG: pantetheine-phosphate adenylyltransferase [Candidatus Marinimicrobia bacterium]|nr:pantetheine-phosphate adenylyltransferase [Candidatus Neomarinimicrobiota bacterium]